MTYQRVGDVPGGSDSEGKLKQIKLPYLKGKSFLDIGCNMGFFCRAARERGATRVVGIDAKVPNIEEASRLDPDGKYLAADWFTALRDLDGTFDVIIHLSAFHYVTDQFEFLRLVEHRLAPGGVFILECGVVDSEAPRYMHVRRGKGTTKHVTTALLSQLLMRFAVRRVGHSVDQRGDPVPRFVYHCQKWKPTVVLLAGESQIGKSCLANFLASNRDIATISMDELMRSLQYAPNASVASLLQEYFARNKGLEGVAQAVVGAGRVEEFTASIAELVPNCFKLVVLEGQIFSDGRIRQSLTNQLAGCDFLCWDAQRGMQRELQLEQADGIDLVQPTEPVRFHSRAMNERLVRSRPVDSELMLAVRRAAILTSACWSFPASEAQQFECWLRVDAKSRPVEYTFEVVDTAKLLNRGDVFEASEPPEKRVTEVVEGGDRYKRVSFELPLTTSRTLLRVVVKMASPDDPADHARAFIATPRLVRASAPVSLSVVS